MSTALVTMDELGKMAKAMVASKLFGFKTVEEAMSIMLIAQAEGRPAALAARDYHIIQGRPALKADAMLARFQQEGGIVEWAEYTDYKVSGKFSHPKSCPIPVAVTWTIEMAKRIGLANKDNWRNYPRAMLRSRVISEGVRTTYPGIAVGIYTVDEMQDLAKEKDITPIAGAGDDLTEDKRVEVSDLADRVREWMNSGSLTDAYIEIDNAALTAEEYVYLWTFFDARIRRQLKEEDERVHIKRKAVTSDLITDAQKKRLEARIKEFSIKREDVKAECMKQFGKEHFSELTRDEYDIIDAQLSAPQQSTQEQPTSANQSAPDAAAGVDHETVAAQIPSPVTDGPVHSQESNSASAAAPIEYISKDQIRTLETAMEYGKVSKHRFLLISKLKSIDQLQAHRFEKALAWIEKQMDERIDKEMNA